MNLYVCASAFQSICAECQCSSMKETGGILIGYETSNAVVITNATGPGPKVIASRYHVELDLSYIRSVARAANDRGLQYQGSWHKHLTEYMPIPSWADRQLLKHTANSSNYRLTTAIMIIAKAAPRTLQDVIGRACARGERRVHPIEFVLCQDVD